jgi:hypothetical protein
LALESVLTGALSSSAEKSKFMIPVEINCCQCTTAPERVSNLGGMGVQFYRNACSISPVSVFTKNEIFMSVIVLSIVCTVLVAALIAQSILLRGKLHRLEEDRL